MKSFKAICTQQIHMAALTCVLYQRGQNNKKLGQYITVGCNHNAQETPCISNLEKVERVYTNQHPLQEALKESDRIIKSIFVLKYIDDVTWRQIIEKQVNN